MAKPDHARFKTVGIVTLAAAVAVGALFLQRGRSQANPSPEPPPPDPKPLATEMSASGGGVMIKAMLQSSRVMAGTHETYMAVTLEAQDKQHLSRPPVNVAVVIDRSGSMEGDKLVHAKQAAKQLLAQLSMGDRFSIIAYGSEVDVVFPSQAVSGRSIESASAAIDGIYADGGTNLSGGLMAGKDQLIEKLLPGGVSRVVLISDGRANEGVVGAEELARLAANTAEHGVSITTVGVGLDFDEQVMTRVAVSGRGNYYFVESAAVLAQMFASELGKLGATVATDAALTLRPAAGVEVLEALGYPMYRTGNAVTIPVADLHAGEHRKIVLRLRVSAERTGAIDLAGLEAELRPVGSADKTRLAVAVRAQVTDQQQVWQAHLDKDAALLIERARAAQAINRATELWEKGDADRAEATLRDYDRSAADLAIAYGDEKVAAELESGARRVVRKAGKKLESAPAPSSSGGKRSMKSNRSEAYDLLIK